ncbi:uncharacterized protein MELLADRAFT_72538 [Melampsora larici-populina 98AG31]|uniref:Myb/SANT-like domain-containing protein n=1 Tax=Melampsora larici-populina (strain 98AG31 / pathotype 3-4-7) TaxID=747676 RepID=F4RVE7_MELLP|nr:uncharacterized protein MELLADRAFT_72538 [Melampsora larici-populina 98AG31]EGG03683.1 hypothetical protein MELLADRAFT_72538 [Melampsora larici-populina 98AG31]
MNLQQNQDIRSACPAKCEWTEDQEETMVKMLDISQSNIDCHNGFVRAIWRSIANALKGSEGSSKVKTGDMCNSHWKLLSRRYKDAKQLQKEIGGRWNEESSMIELSTERWDEMASIPNATNKRLGWFRRGQFPLYDAVGAVVDRGVVKNRDEFNTFPQSDRHETTDIDQLERSASEESHSQSSDERDPELRHAKLESDSAHASSTRTSTMAKLPISSSKLINKRKFVKDKSASNEDVPGRSSSTVSTIRSSESAKKKPRESSAELFIDSMESMHDRFLDELPVDLTAALSESRVASLDYLVMAVDVLQKMKSLDTGLLFKALDLFKDEPIYATMFVALRKEDLQIEWLKYKLQRV